MEFKESYKHINPQSYIEKFAIADWYLMLQPELREYFYDYDGNRANKSQQWLEQREEFVKMVNEFLEAGQIALGDSGVDLDVERKPVDTIGIHHSSTPPNTRLQIINTLVLIRLYAPEYSKKTKNNMVNQYGQTIFTKTNLPLSRITT